MCRRKGMEMKIETNKTALGWMGQVRMEVIESGHA